MSLVFHQVDVFAQRPLEGNALAVVCGADELSTAQMAALARWTNLSETTFLLQPTDPAADYRVRIFTPQRELPFAGHPTLGSCHVWLREGGRPRGGEVIQECGAGLVPIRAAGEELAFAAPPLLRGGPVEPEVMARIARGTGLAPERIQASQWADNGPGWVAVLLESREELLAIRPDYAALGNLSLGVIAPWQGAEAEAQFEVRAFMGRQSGEDPVTGSLNASLAQWLIPAGLAPERYLASQGTALGRRGRVRVAQIDGRIWVGGTVQDCIRGTLDL
ncbi:PhzF family phenazine biosynthesis protein [Pseudomonas oryzihabitans]|uniref:PhzF family phenazine biosynthesis protein n=1 Tax=Pseudomonas oryzihabitans TaxID=47885 RepID=UPI002893B5C9|nr:PhzF family phenazine biosynthesis protein [Pseudomonas oryzihabitans]MDT3719037.1 PhzF family phenazine biosynthesis protein [Pseudomonas oryzihabitans]